MKTRRGQRYTILRNAGYCKFEAQPISRVPIKTVPYMKGFIREREDLLRSALQRKTTLRQFEAQIRELYIVNGFTKRNKLGKVVADPWAMLHDFEDRYRAKNPSYESPWEKRRRAWGDFMAKIERSIAMQNRLREKRA